MRKVILGRKADLKKTHSEADWLDLESIASVQLTSEDPSFPIENALSPNPESNETGWRAAKPGVQVIALNFDRPQRIRRIHLLFIDHQTERSQEFVLRYSSSQQTEREIVRQQWNFSPHGSTTEIEDYNVNLDRVGILELKINPDISRDDAIASLAEWRLA